MSREASQEIEFTGDMPNHGETQAEASTASPTRVGQLHAPEKLDFEADDLPLRWKRRKEEINLNKWINKWILP